MSDSQSQQTSGMSPLPRPVREVGETEAQTPPGSPTMPPTSGPETAYRDDGSPVSPFALPRLALRPRAQGPSNPTSPAHPNFPVGSSPWSALPSQAPENDISPLNDGDLDRPLDNLPPDVKLILSRVDIMEQLPKHAAKLSNATQKADVLHTLHCLQRRVSEADGSIKPESQAGNYMTPRNVRPRGNSVYDLVATPNNATLRRAQREAVANHTPIDARGDHEDAQYMMRRCFITVANARLDSFNREIDRRNAIAARLASLPQSNASLIPLPTAPAYTPMPQPAELTLARIIDPQIRDQVRRLNEEFPRETVRSCYEAITVRRGNYVQAKDMLVARRQVLDQAETSASRPSPPSPAANNSSEPNDAGEPPSPPRGRSLIPRYTGGSRSGSRNRVESTSRSGSRDRRSSPSPPTRRWGMRESLRR